jgi:Tol biopolymer transport system component
MLLAAACAFGAISVPGIAGAQFPGAAGRIAFLASFDGQRRPDVYTIATDGSGLRRLTATPNATKSGPVWSPDGVRLTFHVLSAEGPEVVVMKRDGTGRKVIGPGSNPTWGPDGTLLFESTTTCPRGKILATATLAGAVTPLTICGSHPAWSPDGGTIAFTRPRDPIDGGGYANRDVWIAAVDGSGARRIARSAGRADLPAGLFSPSWSPDGTMVAYEEIRDQADCDTFPTRVRIVDVATGTRSRGPVEERGFDWSPAGGQFVVATVTRNDPCVYAPASSALAITSTTGKQAGTIVSVPFVGAAPNLVSEPSWQPR